MPYYNAIQAAKYIGCDPKTVRRMLKRGELTGERTERGWLAIPGGQVEYAKIRWEEEQAKFARPGQPSEALGEVSKVALPKAIEALDSLGRLETRIGQLEEIVSAQNERIASLEQALSNASLHVPRQSIPPLPSSDITPKPKPPIRPSDASSPLSTDLLSARDFAAKLGMEYTILDGYARRGIRGEKMDVTEVETARKGYLRKYFSQSQQISAIEMLRRHGKLQ
jgi:hypothetical protein